MSQCYLKGMVRTFTVEGLTVAGIIATERRTLMLGLT